MRFLVRIFLGFILILARVRKIRNWAKWSNISYQQLNYQILHFHWCYCETVLLWEETNGKDTFKKLGSRIMTIVVYEINVEISHLICILVFLGNFFERGHQDIVEVLYWHFWVFVYASNNPFFSIFVNDFNKTDSSSFASRRFKSFQTF